MANSESNIFKIFQNILEEARIVAPCAHTLFGFQLVVIFTPVFQNDLSLMQKVIHFLSTGLTLLSFASILSLTAYHRHYEPESVSHKVVEMSNKFLKAGLLPLMLSLSLESSLITDYTFKSPVLSIISGVITFIVVLTLWYLVPKMSK